MANLFIGILFSPSGSFRLGMLPSSIFQELSLVIALFEFPLHRFIEMKGIT
jgi:hypothetical protein